MTKLKRFHIVLIGWLLFTIIDVLKKSYLLESWEFLIFQYMPSLVFWLLVTTSLFQFFSKTANWPLSRRLPTVVLLGAAAGVLKNAFAWLVYFFYGANQGQYPLSLSSLSQFFERVTFFYYMESMIIAWVLMIVFFMFELYNKFRAKSEQAAQLEAQLSSAQLDALRMQLQPHFLFNAHNTVSMLIRTKQYDQATTMISKISELLRNALNADQRQFVSLASELQSIKAYLEIEQVRFEGVLEVQIETDDASLDVQVPQLILQPIIENAFKHGISQKLGASELKIHTSKTAGKLEISIFNSGPHLQEVGELQDGEGIGLTNVKKRLEYLYGPGQCAFTLENEDNGVTAKLIIPDR